MKLQVFIIGDVFQALYSVTVICIDICSFRSRRRSSNNDVREELRHRGAVRCERPEVRLGPLLQLHQHLLRHRPVQRRRGLCCPQLGKTGTAPAAGTRAVLAGLSELQEDWREVGRKHARGRKKIFSTIRKLVELEKLKNVRKEKCGDSKIYLVELRQFSDVSQSKSDY